MGVARRAPPAASLGHRLSRYFRRARDDTGSLPSAGASVFDQPTVHSNIIISAISGMVPLLVGICLDFYVVTELVLGNA